MLAFSSYNICPFTNYFAHTFSIITLLPNHITTSVRNISSFFKIQFSEKAKNILFFAFVLQILLILSGTVEVNPGPHISKQNLSFAVWNLGSLPDVTVFPDEHLYYILIYVSNVYNSVSNRLILTEIITFIRNSGRFTNLEAFS